MNMREVVEIICERLSVENYNKYDKNIEKVIGCINGMLIKDRVGYFIEEDSYGGICVSLFDEEWYNND